ncbi:MAG: endo alpha-1,4 polygalactosaminidase [Thermoplasmata archaeon]|nr:MAG: endo alpha-1,4 polygalactosaminidase [Thermoplasmata archaeon]
MKHNIFKIMMINLLVITFVINSGCISEDDDKDEGSVPDNSEEALFPEVVPATDGPLAVNEIDTWAYVIQDVEGNADLLERSRYGMLVIEPTRTDFSDESSRSYKTKDLVTRLKASAGNNEVNRKLVIAYIDIGQAEDWRWYWEWSVDSDWDPSETSKQSDWPSWIITHDPDWIGCFPVLYWHEDWKNIVINGDFVWNDDVVEVPSGDEYGGEGYNSILDEVIIDGFDGIYLDWVEAFSDESVVTAAEAAGIDPVETMFDFIEEMRDYGRTRFQEMGRDPNEWVLIQQNAPDLAESNDPRKFTVIDGIAQEGVWWEGTGDSGWDDPEGYDVSTKEILGADWYNDVLNVWLPAYKDAGIPVFACEYALENAEDVYENLAPDAGFIPYCTRRSLSKLTTTPPSFE